METDKGIYTVDGAEVVTRAYNYLNTDELVDEINRQLIQKQNMVMEDSSFGLGIPLFGALKSRQTMSGMFHKTVRQLTGRIGKNRLSPRQQGAPQINNTAKNMQNYVLQ